jgi:hypothetical protein
MLYLDFFGDSTSSCYSETKKLSTGPRGNEVWMVERICGGFAYSDRVSLYFLEFEGSQKKIFFSYEAGGIYPVVSWRDEKNLIVSLSKADEIMRQNWSVGEFKITYNIDVVGQ